MPPNTHSSPLFNGLLYRHDETFKSIEMKINQISKKWNDFEMQIKLIDTSLLLGLHILSLIAFTMYPYRHQLFLFVLIFVSIHMAIVGITGVHHYWIQRISNTKSPVGLILAFLYYTAGMNRIYNWVINFQIYRESVYNETEINSHDIKRQKEINMNKNIIENMDSSSNSNDIMLRTLVGLIVPVFIPAYFFNYELIWLIMAQIFILNVTWSINTFFSHGWISQLR